MWWLMTWLSSTQHRCIVGITYLGFSCWRTLPDVASSLTTLSDRRTSWFNDDTSMLDVELADLTRNAIIIRPVKTQVTVRLTNLRSISRPHAYGWNLTHSRALQSCRASADEGNQNLLSPDAFPGLQCHRNALAPGIRSGPRWGCLRHSPRPP